MFEAAREPSPEAHTQGVKPVLVTLIAAAGLVTAGTGLGASDAQPALSIVDGSPLIVRGVEFEARERVVVTVSSEAGSARRLVRSSIRGKFLVRFDAIRLDPCTGATLVAAGLQGDFARLKIGLRECPGPALDL
jgi:hypothetical protein